MFSYVPCGASAHLRATNCDLDKFVLSSVILQLASCAFDKVSAIFCFVQTEELLSVLMIYQFSLCGLDTFKIDIRSVLVSTVVR